jgi:thymidylate synthase
MNDTVDKCDVVGCYKNIDELQYLDMARRIIETGSIEEGRNGNTRCLYGEKMVFSLDDGLLPLLTSKKVAWRTCLRELLWFISGSTSNKVLQDKKVNIWNGNSTREFLDSRNLTHLAEGDLGPVYGHQWRHFNAEYVSHDTDYTGKGVDQLSNVIEQLKNDRQSRRIILSAWNPCQLDEMALPPCHAFVQFHVSGDRKLICCLYQRSGDVGLGVPFNIASYAFLTHLLAHHVGLVAHKLIHFIGNAHVYESHVAALTTQLENDTHEFPRLRFSVESRDNIGDYVEGDFIVDGYRSANVVKMDMVA